MANAVSEKSHTNRQNHKVDAKGNKKLFKVEMFARQPFT